MNKPELIENPKDIQISTNIGQSLAGKYKLAVVDKQENVVWEGDWQKNLILNQGMDAVAAHLYADLLLFAAAGVGTRVSNVYTGNSSGSVSTTTLTLVTGSTGISSLTASVGGYTSVVQAGDVLQFDDSSQVTVVAVSNLTASITPSSTIVLQPFTIWKTSQVGLQNEVHRVGSSNYFTGIGYCQTTTVGNVVGNRRSWDFNFETSSVSYTEVGVSWASTGSNTIFSRVLLPAPIPIGIAQKLRLIYELDTVVLPNATTGGLPFTASISGWPVSPSTDTGGFYNIGQYFVSSLDNNGNTSPASTAAIDPASTPFIYLSNFSQSVQAAGVSLDRTGTASDKIITASDSYVLGSYQVFKSGTFLVAQIARNDIRSMGLGITVNSFPTRDNAFNCLFNQPQTKTNVQTLTLSFVYSWSRILTL